MRAKSNAVHLPRFPGGTKSRLGKQIRVYVRELLIRCTPILSNCEVILVLDSNSVGVDRKREGEPMSGYQSHLEHDLDQVCRSGMGSR